jgi:hypothetical protein
MREQSWTKLGDDEFPSRAEHSQAPPSRGAHTYGMQALTLLRLVNYAALTIYLAVAVCAVAWAR